ncbi:Bug family tripartite tricarboxylate transporter substrate binding protein [Ramlibacter henchirensis]|nr:tripartite tricarboxylate transporter substrate binding protein [Ramlibacter henchirensis]
MEERRAPAVCGLRRRDLMAAALGAAATSAFAQADRIEGPLKIVLPFGPGSGTDVYARMVAQHLSTALGVSAVIENRPGANGILAAESVARAKPDGNTLLFTTNTTHAANPHLVKDLRYDPVKDFAPISRMGNLTFFLLVPANSPFRTLKELVEAARKAPNTISYGAANSFGIVSGSKLGKNAGVQFLRVPYKSSPNITTDMLGGQIHFAFVDLAAASPLVKGGKMRALAVLSDKRFPALPDVPTMSEAGYPGFDVVAWFGMFAPAGTPQPIVARLNRELVAVLNRPDLRQKGAELGIDIFGSSPRELEDYVKSQIALWGQFTADAGLKPE